MKLNDVSPVGHHPSLETDAHFENVVRKTTVTTCYVVPALRAVRNYSMRLG